jgi:hypothetical protein
MESGCHDCTSQICARHCSDALQGSSSSITYNTIRLPRANLKMTRVFARVYTGLRTVMDAGSFAHAAFPARDAEWRCFTAKQFFRP